MVINKNILTTTLALMLFYAMMEFFYFQFVIDNYARFGFHSDVNVYKYIESKVIFFILLGISLYLSRVSQFIYSIFIFFMLFFLVPSLVTYSLSNQMAAPLYCIVALHLALAFISSRRIHIPYIKSSRISFGFVMLVVLLVFLPVAIKMGFYFDAGNLLLNDVYNTRDLFDAKASQGINYIFNWLIKVIIPVCIVYFLAHRRYYFAIISILILLYLYLISGNKLVYITLFVVLFFYFSGRDYLSKTRNICVAIILAMVVMALADHFVFHRDALKGIFIMRMLFLPAYLNYYYFDFFAGQPLYYADSLFFNLFNSYPYDRPVGFIIAETYFGVTDMNANNGIIGDGFMNFGFVGVGISILLVALVFLCFNSLRPSDKYLGIFFVIVFLFLSLPLLSMFLTSGLWILLLLGFSIIREDKLDTMNTHP
jgi:hypothetical protein